MKGGRPPHLRLDSNPNEYDESGSSPSQSSPKTARQFYTNDNLNTSRMAVTSPSSTTARHTTTTYLVLSPAPSDLSMASSMASTSYSQPLILRAHTPMSSKSVVAQISTLAPNDVYSVDVNQLDNVSLHTARLVRSESLPSRISSPPPSAQGSQVLLISDQAQRNLAAAGYPHTNDQPARICVQQRARNTTATAGPFLPTAPRVATASAPAPFQPSPPRVGVASSSCPSPSGLVHVLRNSDRPSSSTTSPRFEQQISLESVEEDDTRKESSSSCSGSDAPWSLQVASSNPALVQGDDLSNNNNDDISINEEDEDEDEEGDDSSDPQGNSSVMTEYGGGSSGNSGGAIGQSDQPDTKDGMDELCPVCGDKVSGYHYGLLTCESCKGFFKRTVQNKKVYTCVADRSCIIDKTQRKRCPYCRFQKCLDVGMKLEAVRHDRMRGGRNKFGPMYKRDRARKLQVMRQRQTIVVHHNVLGGQSSGQGSNSNHGAGSLAYAMSSSSSSMYTPPTLHIKQEIQIPQVTSMTSSPGSSPGPLGQQSGMGMGGSGGMDHSQVLAQHTDPSTGGVQWQISSGNKEFQFQSGMGGNGGLGSGGVLGMGSTGGKMPAILREFLTSLDDKEWQSELYKLLQSQSFNQVEVDLFELLCKVLDHNLFAQVDWARNSYYFKELKVDDQMTLLQNSWSEMLILDQIHQRMHNHLPDETTLHNGQKFELLSLALLGVPSMSDTFQELTSKLTALKFDSADYVCLKFVLLLNPDVRNLNNRKHVQDCFDQVRRVLLEYCVNCYPNVPDKFNQLLSLLPDLREMAQRGEDFLYFKHMQGNAPTQTLLMEMLHAKKR